MALPKKDYDAVVAGVGPNGLAAAVTLQQAGLSVLLVEGEKEIAGGLSTQGLNLPGTCFAIHPLAVCSPFFRTLPLEKHGLQFVVPSVAAAHSFDDGTAAALKGLVQDTAQLLGKNEKAWSVLPGNTPAND